MDTKQSGSRFEMMKIAALPILLLFGTTLSAQDCLVETKRRTWFLPDHFKLQFAGNIGFLSGGPGYISRNKTLETDFLVGYLPQKYGGDALVTVTGKTTYSPWRIHLKDHYNIAPFSLGAYLSYTFGTQFDTKWPSHYPIGYYWWATSFRSGAYLGGKVGKNLVSNRKRRQLELYYELGTYDLLLISYVQNTRYLKPGDIVNLAFGLKVAF